MALLETLMQRHRVPRKTILPFVEQQRHIFMQCPLRPNKPMLRRDGTLAAHRVDGHHRAVQLQQLQQLAVIRSIDLALPQHQPLL